MSTIAEVSLEPEVSRWVLVAATIAALFIGALLLLGQATPTPPAGADVHVVDTGL